MRTWNFMATAALLLATTIPAYASARLETEADHLMGKASVRLRDSFTSVSIGGNTYRVSAGRSRIVGTVRTVSDEKSFGYRIYRTEYRGAGRVFT